MSGHSKWATIKRKKGAEDSRRAKLFTKIQKEIAVAAKMGEPNPEFNPRLRSAVITARAANMPKDKIEAAIKKASSGADSNYEEIKYEGYASGGIAIIVEALTDNKNRTASNVRSTFTKFGGAFGESGSVSFMFDKVGIIAYNNKEISEEKMFEIALEAGAESVESTADGWHEIICTQESFGAVRDFLISKLNDPEVAKLGWKAKNTTKIEDLEKAQKLLNFIEKLEEDDDVQNVTGNYEIPDDIMQKIMEAE